MSRLTKKLKQARGFTLIEMLAVIALLGVLIAVAAPNIFGTIERAEAETLRAEAKAVKNAAMTYITLERINLEDSENLDSIENMVKSDGTLNDYIEMSVESAKDLDERVNTIDNWQTVIDDLDAIISDAVSEDGTEDGNGG